MVDRDRARRSPASEPCEERIIGFPPIVGPRPTTLILGTLPGVRSLQDAAYYAHPRNAFWPIMASIFGFSPASSYAVRSDALRHAGVAVWDVLRSAHREGSLDSAIRDGTPNDLLGFLAAHQSIESLLFNGQGAARLYARHIVPDETQCATAMRAARLTLPSTSPAFTMPFEAKLNCWRRALETSEAPTTSRSKITADNLPHSPSARRKP